MEDSKLLKIVRDVITSELEGHPVTFSDIAKEDYELFHKAAVFVTLTQGERLRGCIGSLEAFRSLGEDLIANAKAAAFNDPRFLPLTKEELPETQIEISVLTQPQEIEYTTWEDLKSRITPLEDGIILRVANRQATFLPQVWEQLPDFESFMNSLARKAGVAGDIFSLHPQILVYHVKKVKE